MLREIQFDYDPEKSQKNHEKHSINFEEAKELWTNTHIIIPARNVEGEVRFAILGKIRKQTYMAIYTEREGKTRIISCHQTGKKWEKIYNEYIKKEQAQKNH